MNFPSNPRVSLENQRFQVVVIGGGINGVAVARQCARAGKQTLLVEQNDFASGVTSRSTRIIHGGLRYLEHGELGCVRESLQEREKLLRERSHLVHPMRCLLLLNERSPRSAMKVRAGLWLYRRLAGKPSRTESSETELTQLERALDSGRRWTLFDYEDAQCEFPERLVAEWLREATAAGAIVRNHMEALAIEAVHGRVRGVLLRDQITGREQRVDATWVINCTGPWADRVCQRSPARAGRPLLGGVRGAHIVIPRFPGSPGTSLYAEAADGRPFFVIPWNHQILVGSTEVADDGDPGKTVASAEEISYLLSAVAGLFPKAALSAQSIRYAFAGIRPLPYAPGNRLSAVTRRHIVHDHAADGVTHLLSVIGGKLTTAAAVARDCGRKIGISAREPSQVALGSGPALDLMLENAVLDIARSGGVSEETARGLLEWYGGRALAIADMAQQGAEWRAPICPHTSHVIAEVVEAYRSECAVTLGDMLLRRVPVALGACWSEACSREAAFRIGAVLGWNKHVTTANLEGLEVERAAFLQMGRAALGVSEVTVD